MSIVSLFSTFVILFVLVFSFNFCVLFYAFENKQISEKYRAILLIAIISVAILSLLGIITSSISFGFSITLVLFGSAEIISAVIIAALYIACNYYKGQSYDRNYLLLYCSCCVVRDVQYGVIQRAKPASMVTFVNCWVCGCTSNVVYQ